MGNDGGDIPGRKELVRQHQVPKLSLQEIARSLAQLCSLTKSRLEPPLAVDFKGRLYSYLPVLESLAKKKNGGVIEMDGQKLFAFKQLACKSVPVKCAVTGIEFTGRNAFWVNWGCGCLLSGKARAQLSADPGKCQACGLPSKRQVALRTAQIESQQTLQQAREKTHSLKLKRAGDKLSQDHPPRKIKPDPQSLRVRARGMFGQVFHKEKKEDYQFHRQGKLGMK